NRAANGEYRWFLNRANPYRDPGTGQIIKWFGVGVDIHDRKLAEQALRKSEENLERKVQERTLELGDSNLELMRSNKNLEAFAYAASHDLKEPVRKINVFTERLRMSLGNG
ncbi:MAG TPA: PAS domain-containing sensor histidine kinase, partial [Chitinophagaceae bacterium]|nr:PAS domain-containing sensor histidine kinase [Chitinophagaceae bacterium]